MRKIIFLLVLITLMLLSGEEGILGDGVVSIGGSTNTVSDPDSVIGKINITESGFSYGWGAPSFDSEEMYISSVRNGVPIFTNNRTVPGSVTYNGMSAAEYNTHMKLHRMEAKIDSIMLLIGDGEKMGILFLFAHLYVRTDDLEVRIDSLEGKISVLEKAIESKTFNDSGQHDPQIKVDAGLIKRIDTLYRLTNNLELRAWHSPPHRGKVKGKDEWRYGSVSQAPMGWIYFEEDSLDISTQMWDNKIIEKSLGAYFPYLSSWLEEEIYEGDIFRIVIDYTEESKQLCQRSECIVEIKNDNYIPTIELRDKDNKVIFEGCSLYYIMQNSFRFDKVGNAYDNPELLE